MLRSDSMLKAIGKSINIRVASNKSSHIPIIILGNTPITTSYRQKVDHLKNAGIIQGFWSLNPAPSDITTIEATKALGFKRFNSYNDFENDFSTLLTQKRNFFSSMISHSELGKIIEIANKEKEFEKKAEKFLSLIKGTI